MSDDFNDVLRGYALKGLRNQVKNPEDYIGPDNLLYCGKCHAPKQQIVILDDDPDAPPESNQMLVAVMCPCEIEAEEKAKQQEKAEKEMARIEQVRHTSLIDEKFRKATFSTFKETEYNARNLKLCRRYAAKFDQMVEKNQGLLFWGREGTGKSFAAACIANYLMDRGVPIVMTSFVKLLEAIQKSSGNGDDIIAKVNEAKLLILDDLGAERDTSTAIEKVYNIIDSRYRREMPMILTTNLTLKEMEEEPDIRYRRIYDRIFEVCYPMQFTGVSWRKKTAHQRFEEMGRLLGE